MDVTSDHYVILLNEIDAAFEAEGIDTRLVFIMYVETERPPITQKLRHPERFLLISAIGQPYETGYVTEEYTGEIPPYERNNFKAHDNSLRMLWHRQWREHCGGIDSVIFEYRFYTDHYCDPGYMRVTRETYRDMRSLKNVGFSGCMNDQTHRVYMPTSLPVMVMARRCLTAHLILKPT